MLRDEVDPRRVCNLILDEAGISRPLTNISLQKLLYFVHGFYLVGTKRPLVSGHFEAWQYGPVHPVAYDAFKKAGDVPIEFRAERQDPLTGQAFPLPPIEQGEIRKFAKLVVLKLGHLSAGRLVDLSHAPSGPWHHVVDKARINVQFGLRIANDLIEERFKFHKITVGSTPMAGEPREDAPFAGN